VLSRRYKEDIQDMGDTSSGLLRLRPVTFRYKKPFTDGSQPVQYGLIAEEVAEVYPDLVAHSADGQIETVKYQVLGPMLLNELQKQNTTIAAQKEQIQAQDQRIRSLEERLARVEAALQQIPLSASSR
jgi:polyhydroxyalkanoate synthesis regulator phasin